MIFINILFLNTLILHIEILNNMGIIKVKPNTAARREFAFDDFADITGKAKVKSLLLPKKSTGGRNFQGKITIRHKGGGVKRAIRIVDFLRNKYDVPAKVAAIEYDPGRGARIALLNLCRWRKKIYRRSGRFESRR